MMSDLPDRAEALYAEADPDSLAQLILERILTMTYEHLPVRAAPDKDPYTCAVCRGSWPCTSYESLEDLITNLEREHTQ